MRQLAADFHKRVSKGFSPRTLTAYKAKFRLYMGFLVQPNLQPVDTLQSVSLFIEYLAQQGLRAQALSTYTSVLKHIFWLYDLNVTVVDHRLIRIAIKAVAYNFQLSFRIKGVLTVQKLKTSSMPLQASQMARPLGTCFYWVSSVFLDKPPFSLIQQHLSLKPDSPPMVTSYEALLGLTL